MNPYSDYNRQELESLDPKERAKKLQRLEKMLADRLSPIKNREEYFAEVEKIIVDLRLGGHDLWSHDYDGVSTEVWGWNYMDLSQAGHLKITFTWNGKVEIHWQE